LFQLKMASCVKFALFNTLTGTFIKITEKVTIVILIKSGPSVYLASRLGLDVRFLALFIRKSSLFYNVYSLFPA